VDAGDVGRPPGTVVLLDPDITDVRELGISERRDALADMHLATPQRAFTLARGLDVLPAVTLIVGCQHADAQR
jgi:hydrogenase maturation protease